MRRIGARRAVRSPGSGPPTRSSQSRSTLSTALYGGSPPVSSTQRALLVRLGGGAGRRGPIADVSPHVGLDVTRMEHVGGLANGSKRNHVRRFL